MSEDHAADGGNVERRELPASEESRASVETYEDEDGVVLYDAENPLAWMKAAETVVLAEQA